MQQQEMNQRHEYVNFLTLAWLEARQRHGPFPRGSELNIEPMPLDMWREAVEVGPRSRNMEAPPSMVMLSYHDESLLDMVRRNIATLQRIEAALLSM